MAFGEPLHNTVHQPAPPHTTPPPNPRPQRRRSPGKENDPDRTKRPQRSSADRLLILAADSHTTPHTPPLTRSSSKISFRLRKLEAAPVLKPAVLAEEPTLTSSRSSTPKPSRFSTTPTTVALPEKYLQRARSAPKMRPPTTTNNCTPPMMRAGVGVLGESLRYSSAAMLQRNANPLKRNSLGVPAARLFFDPTTGHSIALRCD